MYGIPGYDHLLPDDSEAGQQAWRAEAEGFVREADAIDRGTLSPGRRGHARLHQGRRRPGSGGRRPGQADDHTVTAMHYADRPCSWRWRPGRSWWTGGGGGLPHPAPAQRRLARPGHRSAAGGRGGGGCRSPRWPSRPSPGPRDPGRPPQQPVLSPAAAGWSRAADWEDGPPGGGGGCRQPGPGQVGGHGQGPAAPVAAREQRAALDTRRGRRLRPAIRVYTTLPLSAESCTRPGSTTSRRWRPAPWSSARRPGPVRAGRGFRRAAGLGREAPSRGGIRRAAGRRAAGRGAGARNSSPPRSRRPAR